MNKFFKLFTLLVVIIMIVGCLAACDLTGEKCPPHTDANTDYLCDDCGEWLEKPHQHTWVDATCTEAKKCSECGETEGEAAGHTWVDATCTEAKKCSVCGETEGEAAGHNYVEGKCQCGANDPDYVPEFIDYASQVKFDPNSGKVWAEVTVKSYIDGDTTHFFIDDEHIAEGYLKARYLGINTPESTGVVEPWGKKASNYTKNQLVKATSIIVESDTASWNLDSTGGRYLVWVWYKTAEDTEYRNLNLEILQQGLAYGSNVTSNTYGTTCLAALNQAKAQKLHVFSKEKDPDFYYGGAVEISLKELKSNTYWDATADNGKGDGGVGRWKNKYEDMLIKFEGVVAKQVGATVYIEEYDAENDMYFGMQIFCGYSYPKMDEFQIGNRVVIVGKLQYYANGETYQVSDLKYKTIDPDWEGGCRVLSTGHSASFNEVDVNTIMNGTITLDVYDYVEGEDGEMIETVIKKEFDYGQLAHYSTATVKNLTVQSVYTTVSDTDSNGALTITCKDANGHTIKIRTAEKLIREDKSIVVASDFPKGTVISVVGIIDSFNGEYQIKVFDINDITFE